MVVVMRQYCVNSCQEFVLVCSLQQLCDILQNSQIATAICQDSDSTCVKEMTQIYTESWATFAQR